MVGVPDSDRPASDLTKYVNLDEFPNVPETQITITEYPTLNK